jgi:hypothetical protein
VVEDYVTVYWLFVVELVPVATLLAPPPLKGAGYEFSLDYCN